MDNGNQAQKDELTNSDVSLSKKIELHKELSNTVSRTMFIMLAYSTSCIVIIAQPDVPFVLTSSGVEIPVINVAVNLKAFLLIGPLGLIVMTTYLHLFLARVHKMKELAEFDKQPFIFNFHDKFSRCLSFVIFFAIPPIVMAGFSWKSAVIKEWQPPMYFATLAVTVGMLILYLKSRRRFLSIKKKRSGKEKSQSIGWQIIRRLIKVLLGILAIAGMAIFSIYLTMIWERNLNLSRANLAGAKLRKVNLGRANLEFADLSNADLLKANLPGANLSDADLSYANLSNANLAYASLGNADLRYADLIGAKLRGASLYRANLSNVDLSNGSLWEAKLNEVNLSKANLRGADLTRAELKGADLSEANLSNANLRDADLSKANLSGADLSGAKLLRANLIEAEFRGAGLHGADLTGTFLRIKDLCTAKTVKGTIMGGKLKQEIDKECPQLFNNAKNSER
jgi:uncharacterized protein YjbI with pentapeptide repeats